MISSNGILSVYITKNIFKIFLIMFIGLFLLFFAVDFFETTKDINKDMQDALKISTLIVLYRTPSLLETILHFIILLSGLFVFFKLSNNTIRTYLHKGNKLNWCNYAPKTGNKKISVYKNGELIGIFQSINYFSKHSIDIIGFRIENKNITRRLDSKNKLYGKLYKGVYEFKEEF